MILFDFFLFLLLLTASRGILIGGKAPGIVKKFDLSRDSMSLKSIYELIATKQFGEYEVDDALFTDVSSKLSLFGRDEVEKQIKLIQRLQLQLDRSDGRSGSVFIL